MARSITLTSGSILNGSPITFTVQPNVIIGKDEQQNPVYPSFHRVTLEVTATSSAGGSATVKMSSPVESESEYNQVNIDISSVLRIFRDSYEYTPNPTTYPLVKFNVKAYDEYMVNGEVKSPVDPVWYPQNPATLPADRRDEAYLCTIFGAFSDLDRLLSNGTKGVKSLTRKPVTSPQLVAVGETLAYTPAYATEQQLLGNHTLTPPESKAAEVKKEGQQTLDYQSIYALPASEAKNRQVFRFINSFGVMESISVPRAYSKKLNVTSTPYAVSRPETFNTFSRSVVRKQNNREAWLFSTDPLTEDWLHWYLHEFLMSEHVWIMLPSLITGGAGGGSVWLPVTITPEEETTFRDRTKSDHHSLLFSATLDINGSPIP